MNLLAHAQLAQQEADNLRMAAASGLGPLLEEAASLVVPSATPPQTAHAAIRGLARSVRDATGRVASASTRGPVVAGFDASGKPRLSGTVDERVILGTAAQLAAELDAAIPLLESVPSRGAGPGQCDIHDGLPLVCVAGDGPNEHTTEAALTIDLGGDDTYRNSSGGANSNLCGPTKVDPARPWCQVDIVIDLAGDDQYIPSAEGRRDSAGQVAVTGAGVAGIGMLIDLAGDDVYAPTAEPQPSVFGQGAGVFGVGILSDLGGNDRYALVGTAFGAQNPFGGGPGISGHGAGSAGLGILHDATGNDTYELALDPGAGATVGVSGQGYGVIGGTGILLDGGGSDTLVMRVREVPPEEAPAQLPITIAHGQGHAALGNARLLIGEGDTTYLVDADAGSGAASIQVQSVNWNSGEAVVDDLGGNDVYEVDARSVQRLESVAVDGCECDGALATLDPPASISITGQAFSIPILSTLSPGTASAVLSDRGGDDRYDIGARLVLEAIAQDTRPDGSATADVAASFTSLPGRASIQGQGQGAAGPAVLLDMAGDDHYRSVAEAVSIAHAEAAPGRPAIASAISPRASVTGVGGGVYGGLLDLGGLDDYEVSARARAETTPEPEGAVDLSSTAVVLGAFGGTHLDSDEGQSDTYLVDPERGVSTGARGEGPVWGDTGVAANSSTAARTGTDLSILSVEETPGGRTRATVSLTSGGMPLAGREVVLEVEEQGPTVAYPLEGSAHATTDEQGRATLSLDLEFARRFSIADRPNRLVARFTGDRTLRWSRAALPLP